MSNRRRGELYRLPRQGKIAGVCAGIADYFGWETWLVRVLMVSGVLFGIPWLILLYIAAWFILDKKIVNPTNVELNEEEIQDAKKAAFEKELNAEPIRVKARVWQAGEPPKQAFHDIRRKYMSMEKQLRMMEQYVTSPEFTVSREINKL